jgi:uncharacterized glyoxalase superfamily protein PhnB
MSARFDPFTPTIIPTLRYRDVPRAVDWLCAAFGFEKHLLVDDADGGVVYAELAMGASMIMLGPAEGSAFDGLMKQPDQLGGAETQICYLYVTDADAHRQRAVAAGAEIVLDIDAEGYTGRGYSCRDPEGHIWNFGTYNPWTTIAPNPARAGRQKTLMLSTFLLLAALAIGLLIGRPEQPLAEKDSIAFWMSEPKEATNGESDKDVRFELAKVRAAKEASERTLRALEEQLALERSAHVEADRSFKAAQAEMFAKERTVVASISSGDRVASEALERERSSRLAAEQTLREVREQLQQARSASQSSERALQETRTELSKANAAWQAAERLREERTSNLMREATVKPETGKHGASRHARLARYRAARLAARARVRRLREAREPMIKPSLPYF